MSRQTILITGANKGIGLALVEEVLHAQPDVYVLLGSRDAARGTASRTALLLTHPEWASRIEVIQIDVLSDASVAAAAKAVAMHVPLAAIVNNAGGGNTESDHESHELNFRGAARVTSAFLPLLKRPGGRIVNMSSSAGPMIVSQCTPERIAQLTDPSITWERLTALEAEWTTARTSGTLAAAGFCAPEALGGYASSYAYFVAKALLGAYTLHLAREHPDLVVVSKFVAATASADSTRCCLHTHRTLRHESRHCPTMQTTTAPGFIKTDAWLAIAKEANKTLDELTAEYALLPPKAGTTSAMRALFGDVVSGAYYGSPAADALRARYDLVRQPGEPEYNPGDDAA